MTGKILLAPVVIVLGWAALGGKESKSDKTATAKKAIRKVLEKQVAAWNKGDLDRFMAGYWKSPNLVFFSGKDKTRGWEATLKRYQKKYQSEAAQWGS